VKVARAKKGKKSSAKAPKAAGPQGVANPLNELEKIDVIKADDLEPNVTAATEAVHGHSDAISKDIEGGFDAFGKQAKKDRRAIKKAAPTGKALPWMDKNKKKQADKDEMKKKHAKKLQMKKEYKKKQQQKEYEKKQAQGASLLQLEACAPMPDLTETKSTECTTVMDVLRTAIKETVRGIIACLWAKSLAGPPMGPAPAPAMMSLPIVTSGSVTSGLPAAPPGVTGLVPLPVQEVAGAAAFLRNLANGNSFLEARSPAPAFATAPGPAPGPASPVPDVKIFVTFAPGRDMEGGKSTLVEIAFIDRPANGIDDVALVMPLVEQSIGSGLFHKQIRKALHAVTGMKPKLRKVEMKMKQIEQWEVQKCEQHIKGIVQQFTLHYTRNQVPMALYNECTNFMTKMSFSHDYVLDPMDTVRCRQSTAKFAEHWNLGENARDSDFQMVCVKACEAKFGRNAPKCNLVVGDGLLNQPM